MLFFSGSSLNIFSIIITAMAMWTPIKNIISINQAFAPYETKGVSLIGAKMKYFTLNMGFCLAGMYKVYYMGIIPFSAEDWISLVPNRPPGYF